MKKLNVIVAVSTALLALAAVAQPVKTLKVCTEASPDGFDYSLYHANSTADAAAEPLYNRLVEFKLGTTVIMPALAEKWTISPDGKTYIFSLRQGVKFHTTEWFKPTRPMNADDVVFTIQRQIDATHPWYKAATQGWFYAQAMDFSKIIKSVSKVDDYTVRFELNQAVAPFLADMAMDFTSILSAEYADKLLKDNQMRDMDTKPVGTGPFVFKGYEKDQMIRYEANAEYFRGRPKVDKMVFSIAPDAAVRLQRLKAGECDVMVYPRPQDWPQIESDAKLNLIKGNPLVTSYVALNVQHKPLDNKFVRQALSLATDREKIVHIVNADAAEPATNPYPKTQWSYSTSVQPLKLDVEKAKKLLAQGGYPNGFPLDLWVRPGTSGSNPNPKLTAEILQADWKKIGVEVNVRVVEWGELLRRARKGEHDAVVLGWASDNGDPDNFLAPNLSCAAMADGGNFSRWCNKDFDAAIQKATQVSDLKERTKQYEQAQVTFNQESPWVPMVHPLVALAANKKVSGIVISPLTLNNFANVDIK
jgi:dipeptide transport system substrate-binding protein